MTLRATIQRSVMPGELLKRVPQRFHACVDVGVLGDQPVDLLLFPPDAGHVVTSKDIRKAVGERTSAARLVAIGYNFTAEARDLVDSLGGWLFAEHGFFEWTDDTWRAIRQR